ncbi:hypothetical protein C2845_PM13G11780 [Panicum miliaceum]|uniref:RRM domain-containing protein n=1 Tax=Panicum miliaceum TaxID=4540 RepID=A0A3L6RFI9_PANMI|nr:hypothetical protein C2845_PM13G11780 [Panicum miliaceum]
MEARSTSQTSGGLAEAIFLFRRATHPSPVRLLLADGDSARAASLSPAAATAAASPSPQGSFRKGESRLTPGPYLEPDLADHHLLVPPFFTVHSGSQFHLSRSEDDRNPGNNLYVTGLSTRVTEDDLEKFFNKEGKVKHCHVVLDPRTKESRGFAFVTMDTVEDARRCIKYLHRTVLEGRLVTVEKCGEWGKPHVWLLIWGLNSSRADFMTFQFNMVLGCLDVNLGCAADVVVLITNPRAHLHRLSSTPSSPTLHTHYINARAATIERPWSLVVHCATITASTIATSTAIATATASAITTTTAIVNVARMIQQAPWFVYVN